MKRYKRNGTLPRYAKAAGRGYYRKPLPGNRGDWHTTGEWWK